MRPSLEGCFYVALYYVFWCDTFLRNFYCVGITVVGACVASVTSLSVFSTNQYRHIRAGTRPLTLGSFVAFGLLGVVPVPHFLFTQGGGPDGIHWNFFWGFCLMGFL